jgi:hypothetical protein
LAWLGVACEYRGLKSREVGAIYNQISIAVKNVFANNMKELK